MDDLQRNLSRACVRLAVVLLTGLTLIAPAAMAQEENAMLEDAQGMAKTGDYEGAAQAFQAVLAAEPENTAAMFGFAQSSLRLKAYADAVSTYEKLLDDPAYGTASMLGIARAHAAQGHKDEAIDWLEKIAATGAKPAGRVAAAEELKALEGDARFEKVVNQLKPCSSPEYRQFDFWIGTWDVVSADGTVQGAVNSITPVEGGCVLEENYVSGAFSGRSLNFYDASTERWYQTWIDNQGAPLFLSGGLVDGKMVLQSDAAKPPIQRITWTPLEDGRVRQLWEQSEDGAEWTTAFDGFYTRKAE